MTLNDLCASQGHLFLKYRKNCEKFSNDSESPTPCRVAGCITSITPTYLVFTQWCTYLIIYLLTQLARVYKTGHISETVEDRAKVTINGLYKVVHGLSIAAKEYDLE